MPTSTVADDLMEEVVERLRDFKVVAGQNNFDRVRRDHRTLVPREESPAVHVIDGIEEQKATKGECRSECYLSFRLRIIVRDDAGYNAAKPIKINCVDALKPNGVAYPHDAILQPTFRIVAEQEVADADVVAVDVELSFKWFGDQWVL